VTDFTMSISTTFSPNTIIKSGEMNTITQTNIRDKFNAMINGSTGHTHDGTTGNGSPIVLQNTAPTVTRQLGSTGGILQVFDGTAARTMMTLETAQNISGIKTMVAGGRLACASIVDSLVAPIGVPTATGGTGSIGMSGANLQFYDGSAARTVDTLETAQNVTGVKTLTSPIIASVTSDPASPAAGQIWYRSDLGVWYQKGADAFNNIVLDYSKFYVINEWNIGGLNISDKLLITVTGSSSVLDGKGGQFSAGALQFNSGATINSTAIINYYNNISVPATPFATLPIILTGKISVSDIASDRIRFGLSKDNSSNSNDSVYFEFDTSVSPNWRTITKNGATATTNTSGTAVTAGDWNLRITWKSGNIVFEVNGVVLFTHTTNLPASTAHTPFFYHENLAASNKTQYLYGWQIIGAH